MFLENLDRFRHALVEVRVLLLLQVVVDKREAPVKRQDHFHIKLFKKHFSDIFWDIAERAEAMSFLGEFLVPSKVQIHVERVDRSAQILKRLIDLEVESVGRCPFFVISKNLPE